MIRPVASQDDTDATALDDLAGRLDVGALDRGVLARALVHRSWAFEHDADSNERLEFLGDAVLGLAAADEIFHLCPGEPEGRLASLRAIVVSQPTLAQVARELELGDFLQLGVGEANSGGADKDSLLSDAVEAVLGAVYIDLGFTIAYELAQRLLAAPLADLLARTTTLDAKTALQEHTEATVAMPPSYETTRSGPDHAPVFHARALLADEVVGEGSGGTKKAAERAAAVAALDDLAPDLVTGPVAAPPVGLAGSRGRGRGPTVDGRPD